MNSRIESGTVSSGARRRFEGADRGLELGDAFEGSAADRLAGDDPEEDLDEVQPRARALVVVGGLLGQAGSDREHRLGAIERLDLGRLIDAEHDRVAGRIEVQAHDVADLRLQRRRGARSDRRSQQGRAQTLTGHAG